MRRRAYLQIFVGAIVLALLATTLAPDVLLPAAFNRHQTPAAASFVTSLFNTIAWPPQVVARALGIWIDSHSAQLWPPGWPAFAAFGFRLSSIAIPFWFLVGVLAFEIARATVVLARRIRPS